jgi:hypothetical protein
VVAVNGTGIIKFASNVPTDGFSTATKSVFPSIHIVTLITLLANVHHASPDISYLLENAFFKILFARHLLLTDPVCRALQATYYLTILALLLVSSPVFTFTTPNAALRN